MAGLTSFLVCIVLNLTLLTSMASSSSSSQVIKGGYWPSYDSNFPSSAIDTSLFTHLYYAFLIPNNVTFQFDISNSTALLLVNFTSTLSAKNPSSKTLFSVGGGDIGPSLFSRMASSSSSRKNFIDSTIEVSRKFGFDGIDLDWEFPQTPQVMDNFGLLLDEWRAEVQKEATTTGLPPLLLTAAVYYSADITLLGEFRSYPATSITKNLDWINVMCYDYHGKWDTSKTGAHAALFDSKTNLSSSYGLGSWIKAGVPRSKLIMGLPLYGKTWQLKDPRSSGVGASAVGLGPGVEGILTFFQVEMFNGENNATVVYDEETVSTYSVAGVSWVGYDDVRSTTVKIGYARALGMGGYFFWAVNNDYEWKISTAASKSWTV